MSWGRDFVWPWQKNWLKPPTEAKEFKHFDKSFGSFWLYISPFPFIFFAVLRYSKEGGALPIDVNLLLNIVVSILIIIGLLIELSRPRFWKLYLSPDGAILQTLFSQHRLSTTQVTAIQESKRYGLSLHVPVEGGRKHLSLTGMKKLTTLRRGLDPYLAVDLKVNEHEFKSHFNVAFVDLTSRLAFGIFILSGFIKDEKWPETFFRWTFFVCAIFMIVDGLRSIYLNIGSKIKLTEDSLTISRHKTETIAWQDVSKITIHDADSYNHGRLNIVTPEKTITIPESVINYWQLVKQVKARIPSSAQVIDETS